MLHFISKDNYGVNPFFPLLTPNSGTGLWLFEVDSEFKIRNWILSAASLFVIILSFIDLSEKEKFTVSFCFISIHLLSAILFRPKSLFVTNVEKSSIFDIELSLTSMLVLTFSGVSFMLMPTEPPVDFRSRLLALSSALFYFMSMVPILNIVAFKWMFYYDEWSRRSVLRRRSKIFLLLLYFSITVSLIIRPIIRSAISSL